MISIQTYTPAFISHFVKSFWFLTVADSNISYQEEIIPDGHHEIIFHLSRHAGKRKTADTKWLPEPDAFIAGQTLKTYQLQLQPGAQLYGIRFYPHTLRALFNFPVQDLTDNIIALQDITDASAFWNCIAAHPEKTFLNFEKMLSRTISLSTRAVGFCYVQAAISEILKHKGNVTVNHLISCTGVSVKYLNDLFKEYVGLNPKSMSSIVKFNHFIAYKNSHPHKSFTECCYESGYYDQSHLIKSFQSFTAQSPKTYFNHAGYINEVFTRL